MIISVSKQATTLPALPSRLAGIYPCDVLMPHCPVSSRDVIRVLGRVRRRRGTGVSFAGRSGDDNGPRTENGFFEIAPLRAPGQLTPPHTRRNIAPAKNVCSLTGLSPASAKCASSSS